MILDRDDARRKILRLADEARPRKFGFGEEVGFLARAGTESVAETITQTVGPRDRKPEQYTWFDHRREYLQKQMKVLDAAWELFTAWKSDFPSNERQQLYETLRSVRSEINAENRDVDAQERRANWRQTQEEHIERWKNHITNIREEISHIEEQIIKCEDMLDNAKSEEFAATVRGWIEEHKERLAYKREKIRELRKKIEDVQYKLDRD